MRMMIVIASAIALLGCSDPIAVERLRKEKQAEKKWEEQKKTLLDPVQVEKPVERPEIKL